MGKYFSIAVAGLIFGFGLALSRMTQANKVLGFLDVTGNWDPSLLFVLGGAVGFSVVAFRFIQRRPVPVLEEKFRLPVSRAVDGPLVVGAGIFGIGWGISGYCPGPGIALLAAPGWETWVFIPALMLGAFLHKVLTSSPRDAATPASPDE